MPRRRKSPTPRPSPLPRPEPRMSETFIFARTVRPPSERPPVSDPTPAMLEEQETTRELGHAGKRENGLGMLGRLAALL